MKLLCVINFDDFFTPGLKLDPIKIIITGLVQRGVHFVFLAKDVAAATTFLKRNFGEQFFTAKQVLNYQNDDDKYNRCQEVILQFNQANPLSTDLQPEQYDMRYREQQKKVIIFDATQSFFLDLEGLYTCKLITSDGKHIQWLASLEETTRQLKTATLVAQLELDAKEAQMQREAMSNEPEMLKFKYEEEQITDVTKILGDLDDFLIAAIVHGLVLAPPDQNITLADLEPNNILLKKDGDRYIAYRKKDNQLIHKVLELPAKVSKIPPAFPKNGEAPVRIKRENNTALVNKITVMFDAELFKVSYREMPLPIDNVCTYSLAVTKALIAYISGEFTKDIDALLRLTKKDLMEKHRGLIGDNLITVKLNGEIKRVKFKSEETEKIDEEMQRFDRFITKRIKKWQQIIEHFLDLHIAFMKVLSEIFEKIAPSNIKELQRVIAGVLHDQANALDSITEYTSIAVAESVAALSIFDYFRLVETKGLHRHESEKNQNFRLRQVHMNGLQKAQNETLEQIKLQLLKLKPRNIVKRRKIILGYLLQHQSDFLALLRDFIVQLQLSARYKQMQFALVEEERRNEWGSKIRDVEDNERRTRQKALFRSGLIPSATAEQISEQSDLFTMVRACKDREQSKSLLSAFKQRITKKEEGALYDKDGKGLLHVICHRGYAELATYLLELGVDPNRNDNLGLPPIVYAEDGASLTHNTDCLSLLLEKGAMITAKTVDADGMTPLHNASIRGDNEILNVIYKWVIELRHGGVDFYCENKQRWTPLCVAAIAGKLETVRLARKFGVWFREEDEMRLKEVVPLETFNPQTILAELWEPFKNVGVIRSMSDTSLSSVPSAAIPSTGAIHAASNVAPPDSYAKLVALPLSPITIRSSAVDAVPMPNGSPKTPALQRTGSGIFAGPLAKYGSAPPSPAVRSGSAPLSPAVKSGSAPPSPAVISSSSPLPTPAARTGSAVLPSPTAKSASAALPSPTSAKFGSHLTRAARTNSSYGPGMFSPSSSSQLSQLCVQNKVTEIRSLNTKQPIKFDELDEQGKAVVHYACMHGHIDLLIACITDFRVNLNLPSNEKKQTPLHYAVMHVHHAKLTKEAKQEFINKLLDARVAFLPDADGRTPIHYAAANLDQDTLILLVDHARRFDFKALIHLDHKDEPFLMKLVYRASSKDGTALTLLSLMKHRGIIPLEVDFANLQRLIEGQPNKMDIKEVINKLLVGPAYVSPRVANSMS